MARDYAFIYQGTSLHVTLDDGQSFTWLSNHPQYATVVKLIRDDATDSAQLRDLMDTQARITAATADYGALTVNASGVFYNGEILDLSITRRIVSLTAEGYDVGPLVKFLEKVLENPRYSAVQELYSFMEKSGMPVTADGDFIAYKIVGPSYMDKYSGKFDNSPGRVVSMKPFEVDDNRHNTCSRGLHVCSKSYLPSYGNAIGGSDRIVICKINPAHVVAVPADYNDAKMRVWKYEVIGELTEKDKAGVFEKKGIFIPSEHHGTYATFVGQPDRDEDEDYGDISSEVAVDEEECQECSESISDCTCEEELPDVPEASDDDPADNLYIYDQFEGVYHKATILDIRANDGDLYRKVGDSYTKV